MRSFAIIATLLVSTSTVFADTVDFYINEGCIESVGYTQTLSTDCTVSQGDHQMGSVRVTYTGTPRTFKAYQSLDCSEGEPFKTFTEDGEGCHSFDGWKISSVREVDYSL